MIFPVLGSCLFWSLSYPQSAEPEQFGLRSKEIVITRWPLKDGIKSRTTWDVPIGGMVVNIQKMRRTSKIWLIRWRLLQKRKWGWCRIIPRRWKDEPGSAARSPPETPRATVLRNIGISKVIQRETNFLGRLDWHVRLAVVLERTDLQIAVYGMAKLLEV